MSAMGVGRALAADMEAFIKQDQETDLLRLSTRRRPTFPGVRC